MDRGAAPTQGVTSKEAGVSVEQVLHEGKDLLRDLMERTPRGNAGQSNAGSVNEVLVELLQSMVHNLHLLADDERARRVDEIAKTIDQLRSERTSQVELLRAQSAMDADNEAKRLELLRERLDILAAHLRDREQIATEAARSRARLDEEIARKAHARRMERWQFWTHRGFSAGAVATGVGLLAAGFPIGGLAIGVGLFWLAPGLVKQYFGAGEKNDG